MASANVSFDEIPGSRRTPGVYAEFNARLAASSLPQNRQSVCLIGMRVGTYTAGAAGVADYTQTDLFSDAEAAALFGYGSQIHTMARAALLANPYIALRAVALPEALASGVAATGTVVLAGTATASGAAILRVAAQRVAVAVAVGDTAAQVVTALLAAAATLPSLPASVAAGGNSTTVSLTAKNKGLTGNDIGLALLFEGVKGLTATVTAMASGVGAPDLTNAFAAIFAAGNDILVMPYRDATSLTAMRSHLTACGSALEMRGAICPVGSTASYGTTVSLAASVNDKRMVPVWLRGSDSLPWELAAAFAAVCAFEEDPARPLNGLELPGIAVPDVAVQASGTEIEACLHNGVTPLTIGPGQRVQIVRAVTSYTLNPAGVEDPAWLDLTSIRTMDYTRQAWRQRMALRFPREKMVARTIRAVRSETLDVLLRLEELEILHNVRELKDRIVFEVDSQATGRLNGRIPSNVVPGLHVLAAVFDLIL